MMSEMCQSCGMIMDVKDYGRNQDGSENIDYCHYCFPKGTFGKNETMDEMIESCIPFRINEVILSYSKRKQSTVVN